MMGALVALSCSTLSAQTLNDASVAFDNAKYNDAADILRKLNPQTPKEESKQVSKPTQQPAAQLSNNMTSSAPSFLPAKTEHERIQRALAALSKQ